MNLSLVTVHYGGFNPLRRQATLRALADWDIQDPKPADAAFLELVCPGQQACYSDRDMPSWIKYIRLHGTERNANLFQKEAMWNLGAKMVAGDKIVFIDSDGSPIGTNNYFETLDKHSKDGLVVHCAWKLINEKFKNGADVIHYSQAVPAEEIPKGHYAFPGIGYVITRKDFNILDGFNPYAVTGAGDNVFLYEACGIPIKWTGILRYFQTIVRDTKVRLKLTCVPDMVMRHNFHGAYEGRAYEYSRKIVDVFGSPKAYVHMDSAGLMAWNDPKCIQAALFMKKSQMPDKKATLELIAKEVEARLNAIDDSVARQIPTYDPRDFNQFV